MRLYSPVGSVLRTEAHFPMLSQQRVISLVHSVNGSYSIVSKHNY
jgi:hypothetical protein